MPEDNPVLNVSGKTLERLRVAMSLARHDKVVGYAVSRERNKITFFWAACPECVPFPSPLSLEEAAGIAFTWLKTVDYGPEPGHDGHNAKGWRCYTDAGGRVDGYGFQSFVAVVPHWEMYGK